MLALSIAVAGGLGALTRWGLTAGVHRLFPGHFPTGTMAVNVIGCFLFGVLAPVLADRVHLPVAYRAAALSGFLGAFTTFSTFSFDTVELYRSGHWVKALMNVGLSLTLCLLAVALGLKLADRVVSS